LNGSTSPLPLAGEGAGGEGTLRKQSPIAAPSPKDTRRDHETVANPSLPTVPPARRRNSAFRLIVRLIALAVTIVLLLPLLPWHWTPMVPLAVSPYVAIAGAIATRSLGLAFLVALPVLLIVLVRRRFFCRWLCPTGLLLEQAGHLHRWGPRRAFPLFPVGQWIVILTLAGAILGYPLLLWLDPLSLLAGALGIALGPTAGTWAALSAGGLGLLLLLSLFWPGTWCLRICPLGATQELLYQPAKLIRQRQARATVEDEAEDADDVDALPPRPKDVRAWPLARRALLGAGLGLAGAAVARRAGAQSPPTLLPPGAADVEQFAGQCIRCGNCVRACPAGILHPDLGTQGVWHLLAPVVRIETDYCRENCNRCAEVCPSGAIHPFHLSEKPQQRIGVAKFNEVICLLTEDRECGICKGHCPYDAITLVFSEVDYLVRVKVDAEKCPGCGACQAVCPTSPEKAILVVPNRAS